MLPHRWLHLAKNTFPGEKAAPASHQLPVEEERRGEKRRSRFLHSTVHFKGETKHSGLMTSLLFLFRTIWDVHDSVRVSTWSLKSLLRSLLTYINIQAKITSAIFLSFFLLNPWHVIRFISILLPAVIFYLTLTYCSASIFWFLLRRCC